MPSRELDGPGVVLGHASTVSPELTDTAGPETAVESASPIGERPEADRLARAIARARIGNQLFARDEQVRLGRYHLLEIVGSGGMGVVWGAWDPELKRRVAIKLVNSTVPAARERILFEGQALAKLSHPNVVPIYDVGVVDEQVYIVMEWVRGQSLRAYCKPPRGVREIVELYRAAGEALDAAHAVGLIHRDFKPDNAMRGDDGRVRVLDFGLARGEVRGSEADETPSSDTTRGAGTPRYMAPEQAKGSPLTPAADQFAFCASLLEAVTGCCADRERASAPSWIASICARGMAVDPKDRFESMRELLLALARDPAKVWRRRLLVAGAALAITAGFVIGHLRAGSGEIARCVGGKLEIAKTWNEQTRDRLVAHLQSLGPYGAEEARRITARITAYGERWALAHHDACLASERGELTPKLYEQRLGCLARGRAGFDTIVEVLSNASVDRLAPAIVAANDLPDADRCASETLTSAIEPPPAPIIEDARRLELQIERARVLAQAADPTAIAAATAAVAHADHLAYPPLVARAYLTQGLARIVHSDTASAIPNFQRAAEVALAASDDVTYVEAFARSVFAIGVSPKTSVAPGTSTDFLAVMPVAERIATRLGATAGFARALLFNNVGVALLSAGDRAGARGWFQRAVDERRTQEGEVELANAFGNLAIVVDRPSDRDPLFTKERTTLERMLGENHVMTLQARLKEAMFLDNPAVVATELRDACTRLQQYHPQEVVAIARCSFELGWLAEERGDTLEARGAMTRVVRTGDPHARLAGIYLEALDGKLADAARHATEIAEVPQGEWWMRRKAGEAYLLAGICFDKLGQHPEAIDRLRSALAIFDGLTMLAQAPYHQRRVARARALIAQLLATSDRTAARQAAAAAAAWYRGAGGYPHQLAVLDAIATGSL
jgi:tetratricopeptide (TPR) repeat protein